MTECHHAQCCGCQLQAQLIAEVIGSDGVTEFELCPPHLALLMDECRRKGLPMVGVSALDDGGVAEAFWPQRDPDADPLV